MATYSSSKGHTTSIAASSLAASATLTCVIDLSTLIDAYALVSITPGGTVAAGAAVTINVLVMVDGTTASTIPITAPAIPSVASTLASLPVRLDGGHKYTLSLVNGDATNAVTATVIYDSVDSFA